MSTHDPKRLQKIPAPLDTEQRPPVFDSDALLQGRREVRIRHGEETYRLVATRNGKLLLQK